MPMWTKPPSSTELTSFEAFDPSRIPGRRHCVKCLLQCLDLPAVFQPRVDLGAYVEQTSYACLHCFA